MTENEFFVAIQGIIQSARDAGWSVEKIEYAISSSVEEWIDENCTFDEYGEIIDEIRKGE